MIVITTKLGDFLKIRARCALSHYVTIVSIKAHVRYIKIQVYLRSSRDKIANFSRLYCLAIPRRDLSTKKTKPNIEK